MRTALVVALGHSEVRKYTSVSYKPAHLHIRFVLVIIEQIVGGDTLEIIGWSTQNSRSTDAAAFVSI